MSCSKEMLRNVPPPPVFHFAVLTLQSLLNNPYSPPPSFLSRRRPSPWIPPSAARSLDCVLFHRGTHGQGDEPGLLFGCVSDSTAIHLIYYAVGVDLRSLNDNPSMGNPYIFFMCCFVSETTFRRRVLLHMVSGPYTRGEVLKCG